MPVGFSINGVPIRLTPERWKHIIERHPEMDGKEDNVLETINLPYIVQQGDAGTLMAVSKFKDRYLVVIYKEINPVDGFVVTAYFTKRLRRRLVLWKR